MQSALHVALPPHDEPGGSHCSPASRTVLPHGEGSVLVVVVSAPTLLDRGVDGFTPFLPDDAAKARPLLEGAALMFVAFTGYGRIATLGEEVREPSRVIPRAIIVTIVAVTLIYLSVAAAGVGVEWCERARDAWNCCGSDGSCEATSLSISAGQHAWIVGAEPS